MLQPYLMISGNSVVGSNDVPYGKPGYSYHFLEQRFLELFKLENIRAVQIPFPEYFSSDLSFSKLLSVAETNVVPIHVCFRPFDKLRVVKGSYNVAYIAWEYAVIKDNPEASSVFDSDVAVLKMFHEVWTASEYAAETLKRAGIKDV